MYGFNVLHVSSVLAVAAADVARASSASAQRLRRSRELCSGTRPDVIPCSDGLRRHPRLQPLTSSSIVRVTVSSSPAAAADDVVRGAPLWPDGGRVSSAPAAASPDDSMTTDAFWTQEMKNNPEAIDFHEMSFCKND
jgi:hypothetical protein